MMDWFHSNFQEPANRLSYNGREGGYLFIHGGPYDAGEELHDNFSNHYPEDFIEEAVDRVTSEGIYEWDNTNEHQDVDPEDYDPEDYDDLTPSNDSLSTGVQLPESPLNQEPGIKWKYDQGRVVVQTDPIGRNEVSDILHTELRQG